jgi:hypothetical protein
MNDTDITVNARITEVETKLADALNRISKTEGAVEQMNKSIASGNRLTNWQFIIFVVAIVGSLLGSMYWATGVLEKRFDERSSQLEKRIDERFSQMEKRFEDNRIQMEKRFEDNRIQMEKRFEDLRQAVLARQKR